MSQFQWKMLNGSTLVTIERLIEVKTGLDIAPYLIIGRPLVMLSGRYNTNVRGILFSL